MTNNLLHPFTSEHTQLLTFSCEVLGMSITIIEIYFENKSLQLQEYLNNVYDNLSKPERKSYIESLKFWGLASTKTSKFIAFIFKSVFVIFTMTLFFDSDRTVGNIIENFGKSLFFTPFMMVFGFYSLPLLYLIYRLIIGFFKNIIQFLNWMTKGKALGTIGLLLSIIGLFFESIQTIDTFRLWQYLDF